MSNSQMGSWSYHHAPATHQMRRTLEREKMEGYIVHWKRKSALPAERIVGWTGLTSQQNCKKKSAQNRTKNTATVKGTESYSTEKIRRCRCKWINVDTGKRLESQVVSNEFPDRKKRLVRQSVPRNGQISTWRHRKTQDPIVLWPYVLRATVPLRFVALRGKGPTCKAGKRRNAQETRRT
jgi:hypothetical protein